MGAQVVHHPLQRADGSATFSSSLFTITAGVNGPIEVQRRDELPEEAAIEVNVRPASGVGSPRERWVESVMVSLLRNILLVHMHPRTLIQVTLQVTRDPAGVTKRRSLMDVAILPALINAAFLALLDSGIPMRKSVVAGLGVTSADERVLVEDITEKSLRDASTAHAMAFDSSGRLLLCQSAGGPCSLQLWERVEEQLRRVCALALSRSADAQMENGDETATDPWLRSAVEAAVQQENAWKDES